MTGKKIVSALLTGLTAAVIIMLAILSIMNELLTAAGIYLLKARRKQKWGEIPRGGKDEHRQ